MTMGQHVLDNGAEMMQSLKLVKQMSQHVCTFSLYNHDMTCQIETHHYITRLNHSIGPYDVTLAGESGYGEAEAVGNEGCQIQHINGCLEDIEGGYCGARVDQSIGGLLEAAWQGSMDGNVLQSESERRKEKAKTEIETERGTLQREKKRQKNAWKCSGKQRRKQSRKIEKKQKAKEMLSTARAHGDTAKARNKHPHCKSKE
ncbi:hypothetical protein FF1_024023 [Malus domestica]